MSPSEGTPDIQALIEEADTYLANWDRDYVQRGTDMIRRLAAALSALSGETETEWEYKGAQVGGKPEFRRRKAGPWIEVTK